MKNNIFKKLSTLSPQKPVIDQFRYYCPNCSTRLYAKQNICKCGQELDWNINIFSDDCNSDKLSLLINPEIEELNTLKQIAEIAQSCYLGYYHSGKVYYDSDFKKEISCFKVGDIVLDIITQKLFIFTDNEFCQILE